MKSKSSKWSVLSCSKILEGTYFIIANGFSIDGGDKSPDVAKARAPFPRGFSVFLNLLLGTGGAAFVVTIISGLFAGAYPKISSLSRTQLSVASFDPFILAILLIRFLACSQSPFSYKKIGDSGTKKDQTVMNAVKPIET